jgi:hypothetical protein
MATQILFRTDEILVTPAVARFGPVSYQIANIASVGIYERRRFNPLAGVLVLTALGLAAFAYLAQEQLPDYSVWSAVAAPVALILGAAWQWFRPVQELRLLLKAVGSDTQTVDTLEPAQVYELRDAMERAFEIQPCLEADRHAASCPDGRAEGGDTVTESPAA